MASRMILPTGVVRRLASAPASNRGPPGYSACSKKSQEYSGRSITFPHLRYIVYLQQHDVADSREDG